MKVINIVTQKGGTGKTETAKNLAYGIAKAGKKVLIIDLDPQSNSTTALLKISKSIDEKVINDIMNEYDIHMKELELHNEEATGIEGIDIIHKYTKKYSSDYDTSSVLLDPKSIKEAISETEYDNLYILPASSNLIDTDMELKKQCMGSDIRLTKALDIIQNDFDVVIIDHSPFINALTINGIRAAKNEGDLIIIPMKLESASLDGVDAIFQQMKEILKYADLGFDFKLLFTMKNRNRLETKLEEMLRHIFPESCFQTTIRYQASPVTTASLSKTVLLDRSHSNVSKDYQKFVDECLEIL